MADLIDKLSEKRAGCEGGISVSGQDGQGTENGETSESEVD